MNRHNKYVVQYYRSGLLVNSTQLAFSPRMSIDLALLGTIQVFRLFGLVFRFTNCFSVL
jgi:hypothetical protein